MLQRIKPLKYGSTGGLRSHMATVTYLNPPSYSDGGDARMQPKRAGAAESHAGPYCCSNMTLALKY